ncbi:hypothetical protein QZH41_005361 [Actinostola sp. cb2023]|nr:hypothetical protein QZH41_005361 [Actinostola sp. cb2023]
MLMRTNDLFQEQAASHRRDDVDPVQLDSMVTNVRDLLPDLGEGFVIKCLEEYKYDIETVINSLLENKLSESLSKQDRSMTRAQAIDANNDANTIISTRHSVFDKDEFDVFTKGSRVDMSRIHKGKKRDDTSLKSLLAEKGHVTDSVRERFNRYDVYGQLNKPEGFDEYDDEYDDTYDSIDVGAQDDDSADELTARRPFTVPRVIGKPTEQSSESDDETAEDAEQDPSEVKTGSQPQWRTPDKRPGHKGFYTEGHPSRGRAQQQGKSETSAGSKGPKGRGKSKTSMDRYKQARDNRRQKPRPSGRVTRCWYSLVSAMFYCIWNNTAVDDIAEAVSQSRQVSQVAMTTNNNKNDETRHSNTTTNQHLDDRKLETRPSRFGGVSPLPGPRDLYLNTASQSCQRQDGKIREPVANGNARPTPRDLYAKKAQRDVIQVQINAGEKLETSQCKESLRDVDQAKTLPEDVILNSTEHTKQAAPVNPTISRTSKKQANKNKSPKKPKKGKKAVCKTTPHSSSLGESSVHVLGSLVKESSKKGKTPKTTQASKEDQHRAVFYEPDGRRKGGSVIKDYYEFLIRLLYTGIRQLLTQESWLKGA